MRVLLFFTCLAAAGCTTLSETECRGTNWYERGRTDARVYAIQPTIARYAQECAAYGVKLPESDYMDGWRQGYSEWNTGGRM